MIAEVLNQAPWNEESFFNHMINKVSYSFTYEKSQTTDWTFVYYAPTKSITKTFLSRNLILHTMKIDGILGFFVLTLFGVIILILYRYFSKRLFSLEAITALGLNTRYVDFPAYYDRLEGGFQEKSENMQYTYFMDLIYGNLQTDEYEKVLFLLSEEKDLKPYCFLMVVSPDLAHLQEVEDRKNDFISNLQTSVKNYLLERNINIISIVSHGQEILCLVSQEDDHINKVFYMNMNQDLEQQLQTQLNIFISSPTDIFNTLPERYNEIKKAYRYVYIYNYSNVFTYEDIKIFDNNSPGLGRDFVSNINSLINLEQYEELKNYVMERKEEVRRLSLSYDYTQNFLMQIMHCISNAYSDKEIKSNTEGMSSLVYDFAKIESMDQCIEWIVKCIEKYEEYVSKKGLAIDQNYIESIVEYIHENVGKASLTHVAETFHISTSHLSRIFKSHMSVNFSEYVTSCRLEKAAEILQSDNNETIAEIAKKLGYETPNYFSKRFKEVYQLTPAMYRKKYLTEINRFKDEE